jgi:hypothetical protein
MLNILFNIIIYPIIQIVEFIFVFAQGTFKITGFSIICVSVAVTVLCLPIYVTDAHYTNLKDNNVYNNTRIILVSDHGPEINMVTHNNSDAKKKPLYIAVSGYQLSGGSNEYEFHLDPTKDYYVHDNLFNPNNWSKAK